ncbi:DUF6612 family protein [Salinithrix halophila]|uniref:DUF6612 family protein n=1 Tax=Salinithrix halophila TaxID=1485204 RepID=A0ABV8JFC6_9BACL
MKRSFQSVLLCIALFAVPLGGCAEPTGGEAGKKKQPTKQMDGLSAQEIIDTSLTSMEKMKGYHWESLNHQQYSFRKQPDKNTRVDWKQRILVTENPVNIQAKGSLTVAGELISETKPQRWYVTDQDEFLFFRNRWYKKEQSGLGEKMKVYADPLWVLRKVGESADVYRVDREGKEAKLTVGLTGKAVEPFIDDRSMRYASIPPRKEYSFTGQRMKIRINIDKKTFRLRKVEQAVEFTIDLGKEKVKTRQEWTHTLQGEAKKITVPEHIRKNARTYPDSEKEETIPTG